MTENNTTLKLQNAKLNLHEYRNGVVKLASHPRFLVVELTQACNLKCPMCREGAGLYAKRNMSTGLFSAVSRELFPYAELVDLRGWGESLILPDIRDKIECTAAFGCEIRFVTNLAFRKTNIFEALAWHNCHVAVSVDAASQETFRHLRGGASLNTVLENLKYLTRLYIQRNGNTNKIHFTTTVQRPALHELSKIVEIAASLGIAEVRLFEVTQPPGSDLAVGEFVSGVDRALNDAANIAQKLGVRLIAGTRLGSMPANSPDGPSCLHPWSYAYISYEGRVGFCDHLIGPDGEPYLVGDLRCQVFRDIWNCAAWQELRLEHNKQRRSASPFFKECAWCYKNRNIDFEDRFDSSAHKRIAFLTKGDGGNRSEAQQVT